ncbi:VOC family protein [uncultured Sphingomonas sp.]|uniref:VOC family protein n=1 Tax=uncultured Sphingomonas sp. TaxID=158754 RepID=UPI0035C99599
MSEDQDARGRGVMSVLVHIGLTVSDMARSVRFYTEAFGFTYDRELRMTAAQIDPLMQLQPPSDIHAVYLMLGGQTLELMVFDPPSAPAAASRMFNQTGLAHLSIAVDDIADTCARAEALGGTVSKRVDRAAILRDPDGQLVELVTRVFNDRLEKGRAERAGAAG